MRRGEQLDVDVLCHAEIVHSRDSDTSQIHTALSSLSRRLSLALSQVSYYPAERVGQHERPTPGQRRFPANA
jgi:hypothetical protein